MRTYAQNFEDVMLARLFFGQPTGFYVDVGANHPTQLSVTRHFYDLGWRGINIEPIEENWKLFQRERPADCNLNVAVGMVSGEQHFHVVQDNSALSTCDSTRAAELARSGLTITERVVKALTLDSVLDEHGHGEIDFINIDVEGFEKDVLSSLDLRRHRPKVLLIEATTPLNLFPGWEQFKVEDAANWKSWEQHLLQSGYVFAHFDGLNRFYVREDCGELTKRLALPPGVFDFILPDLHSSYLQELQQKEQVIQELAAENMAKERLIRQRNLELEEKTMAFKLRCGVVQFGKWIVRTLRR